MDCTLPDETLTGDEFLNISLSDLSDREMHEDLEKSINIENKEFGTEDTTITSNETSVDLEAGIKETDRETVETIEEMNEEDK